MKLKEKEFENILLDLKSLADQIGVKVRFERGDFNGGYCLVKENKMIIINKLSTLQRKIVILSKALKEIGIDDIYLTPKLRELIDEMADVK